MLQAARRLERESPRAKATQEIRRPKQDISLAVQCCASEAGGFPVPPAGAHSPSRQHRHHSRRLQLGSCAHTTCGYGQLLARDVRVLARQFRLSEKETVKAHIIGPLSPFVVIRYIFIIVLDIMQHAGSVCGFGN